MSRFINLEFGDEHEDQAHGQSNPALKGEAHYLAEELLKLPGIKLAFERPFFKEFVIELPAEPVPLLEKLLMEQKEKAKEIRKQIDELRGRANELRRKRESLPLRKRKRY